MLPAMTVFGVLAATMLGVPDQLVAAREAGIFRSYKINGVPTFSILSIPALTAAIHATVMAVIIAITAPLFFNAPAPANWSAFILIFFLTAFACAGLAVLIGVVSSSSRMTVLWSQLIFIPSMMLGGITGVPNSILPEAMRTFAQLLPPMHAMNAFRGLAFNLSFDFNPISSLLILFASGLLSFILAIYLYNWDRHNRRQRGHPLMAVLVLLPYIIGMFAS